MRRTIVKKVNGIFVSYQEVYYLDYAVNEETGVINKNNLMVFYTKEQVNKNLETFKKAYKIASK